MQVILIYMGIEELTVYFHTNIFIILFISVFMVAVKKSRKGLKTMTNDKMSKKCPSMCILRVTLGFVFLYAAITKLFFGSAPPVDMIITFLPADVTLFFLGLAEFFVGVLLLIGLFTRVAGWLAASLFGIFFISAIYLHVSAVIPNLWNAAMLFKDVGLIGAAIALGMHGSHCCSIDALIRKRAGK